MPVIHRRRRRYIVLPYWADGNMISLAIIWSYNNHNHSITAALRWKVWELKVVWIPPLGTSDKQNITVFLPVHVVDVEIFPMIVLTCWWREMRSRESPKSLGANVDRCQLRGTKKSRSHVGSGANIRGAPKSARFTLRGPWMCIPNITVIHPVPVEMFQFASQVFKAPAVLGMSFFF